MKNMGCSMHQVKKTKTCKKKGANVKVVYISSPLMVTTCATKFRDLVQELTGRHSDISHLLENKYNTSATQVINQLAMLPKVDQPRESPTSSASLVDLSKGSYMKDGFLDFLQSDSLFGSSEIDMLRCYDWL